jgi:cell division protein FtsQ
VARRRRPVQARAARARAASIGLPRPSLPVVPERLARFAPSRRSLLVAGALVILGVGAYLVARETSAFAITRIEVRGAPAPVRKQVQHALAPFVGANLLSLDGAGLERRAASLPTVVSATYDRGFPHTLHVVVVPERIVAVLHRGKETWLVSARGRVVRRIPTGTRPGLARIWVPSKADVELGAILPAAGGGAAARAVALATRFPARISTIQLVRGELVVRLRSGLELLLGEPTDVRLKLAIARRALFQLPDGATYVDVSVPGRPVAGASNPQLSSEG